MYYVSRAIYFKQIEAIQGWRNLLPAPFLYLIKRNYLKCIVNIQVKVAAEKSFLGVGICYQLHLVNKLTKHLPPFYLFFETSAF